MTAENSAPVQDKSQKKHKLKRIEPQGEDLPRNSEGKAPINAENR
jgi:hypothetical protein